MGVVFVTILIFIAVVAPLCADVIAVCHLVPEHLEVLPEYNSANDLPTYEELYGHGANENNDT